jgi:hypothetical protein
VVKDFEGKRPRTRIRMTTPGRKALDAYVAYLHDILDSNGVAKRSR